MTEVVPVTVGILQILTPSPQYYRGFYPHSCGITTTKCPYYRGITAIPIAISIINMYWNSDWQATEW